MWKQAHTTPKNSWPKAPPMPASEVIAKLAYEHGFVNLNSFERWRTETGCDAGAACATRYRSALDSGAASGGARLALSVEVGRIERFEFALPGDAGVFGTEEVDRRIATVGFSRRIGSTPSEDSNEDPRVLFELSARYEDVSNDPSRLDRLVAQAGFSRKVSGDLSAGVTLVYSNQPEYRGDVDEELSARLGLKFSTDAP